MDLKFMTSKLLLSKFAVSLNFADKAVGSRSTTTLLLLKNFSMAKLMQQEIRNFSEYLLAAQCSSESDPLMEVMKNY